jgi:hypothetical protein
MQAPAAVTALGAVCASCGEPSLGSYRCAACAREVLTEERTTVADLRLVRRSVKPLDGLARLRHGRPPAGR